MSIVPLSPVTLVAAHGPMGTGALAGAQDVSQRANLVNMQFWGALLERVPHQTWVVEQLPKFNVVMSPSLASTARSLAEAFESEEVSGHLEWARVY